MPLVLSVLLVLAWGVPGVLAAEGVGTVEIREWPVPWPDTRPRDPYVDARGRVWFVGQQGDYVAYLDPTTGAFRRFDLEPGTGPHNLIVDAAGFVWFAGNLKGYIGKLDPETGRITKYPMPDPEARDPHTLVFDRNGDIWFTVQGGNFVGRLKPQTGEVRLIRVPTPRARPYGIAIDSRNRPWFNEFGTNKVGRVDPETMEVEEIVLPRPNARSRRIAITSDDAVWYVDYAYGYLGRIDPKTGTIREWPAPAGERALPYALAADDRDRLWFVETGPDPNRLVGFDPKTETFFSITPIPSRGRVVRHMFFHRPTRTLWFGTDVNTIARARLESPAATPTAADIPRRRGGFARVRPTG